jgi:hypothetical protein
MAIDSEWEGDSDNLPDSISRNSTQMSLRNPDRNSTSESNNQLPLYLDSNESSENI